MEQILIGSSSNKNIDSDINAVVGTFEGDINEVKLRSQLDTWRVLCDGRKIANYMDAKTIVSEHAGADVMLSEVSTILRLIMVLPATNAVSERSFSCMKRLKNWMRTTMTDKRLMHLMLCSVHKEEVKNLNLVKLLNEFVGTNSSRQKVFGTFSSIDVTQK